MENLLLATIVTIKLLMFRTDPSTDFEVHRNWKAITTSLPIKQWYYDETSEWTLDYPPLFAYMEYIIGTISKLFDVEITNLVHLNYKSEICMIFQRLTVLLGDILMFYALKKLSKSLKISKYRYLVSIILIEGFVGLVLVDNMHFQYNMIMFAIMIISISYVIEEKYLKGAIIYTLLICMKHIFIYLAPAYFVFYLKYYVLNKNWKRLILLGSSIILIVILSFAPFIYFSIMDKNLDILIQIFKRMFPFKRGLLHSYWAPNIWALYSFIDKALFFILSRLGKINSLKMNISSSGIVKETSFDVLPNISPKIVNIILLILSVSLVVKGLIEEFKNKAFERNKEFFKYLLLSCLLFFNFGFHVHEKAFMKISIIYIIYSLYTNDNNCAHLSILLGVFTQMPLIHTPKDYIIKITLVIAYLTIMNIWTKSKYSIYILIIVILDLIITFSPHFKINYPIITRIQNNYPFLPLMIYSVINGIITQIIYIKTIKI